MTESVKTLLYAGIAIALLALAIFVSLPPREPTVDANQQLYPEFADAASAARLEIVRIEEPSGKLSRFEVERSREGLWQIPSHGGYPADAAAQMTAAATSLIGLNVVGIASEVAGDQELFGVVEPTESRLEAGDKGFGMLVAFQDRKGDDLARLIVGKKVANTENQRFVRKAGQDVVYVVDLNVDKLTTNFSDWIEKDLLKISPWDIDRVQVKDYQFVVRPGGSGAEFELDPRLELTAGLDSDTNSWTVDKMVQYAKKRPVETQLKADEELNKEKLDELKTAIDNLQIVDVKAKPSGLGDDLSVDEAAFKNPELLQSMQELGFIPHQVGNKRQFLGLNGELAIGTKDGVEYLLRFGNSAGAEEGTTKEGDAKVRRYLFVSARLDNSRLKPPVLEELPAEVPVAPKAEPEADAEKKSEGACQAPDAAAQEQPATEADDAEKKEETPDETKPATSDFDLKRKQIEKENQRKVDDYNERKRKAEAKVRELNARFAGWYYVISDDEYQKIHLTRSDLIKERSGPGAEGYGVDALRELQEQGIIKPAPVPQPPAGGPGGGLPPGLNFGQ